MPTTSFRFAFQIGDFVYHVTDGSVKGIIIGITYYLSTNEVWYIISFGFGETCSCREFELVTEKPLDL